MKKLALILLMCFVATQFATAQSKKMYVSKHGGTKKLLTFGKYGYDVYHYTPKLNACDSLICSGAGYEYCKIDKQIIRINKENNLTYIAYNKAIRATEKRIRKTKTASGTFSMAFKKLNLSIKYYNADQDGNADMEIEIL